MLSMLSDKRTLAAVFLLVGFFFAVLIGLQIALPKANGPSAYAIFSAVAQQGTLLFALAAAAAAFLFWLKKSHD